MSYRVLVTGSREWDDRDMLEGALSTTLFGVREMIVVHGQNPRGADRMAARWVFTARCERPSGDRGPASGGLEATREGWPARNQVMVDKGADVCYAFYWAGAGNEGTADCAERARLAGIPVREFYGKTGE